MSEFQTARAADGTDLYFETHGDRSKPAIFLGPHFYLSRTSDDDSHTEQWIEGLSREFFLIVADYPRGIGRTGNSQGMAYSPDIAAEEYERIADAAGVEGFGWLGYSFGGAMGVQVACRTDRVTALAIGGFPPLNAPFKIMTELCTRTAEAPPSTSHISDPGVLWASVAFYQSLVHWPERQEVGELTMPRLVFMGSEDTAQGASRPVPLAPNLRAAESELSALGWRVLWLEGHGHNTVLRPEVSLHAVCSFFREALLARA